MTLTYFANDIYTVHLRRRPRGRSRQAVIILHGTESRYLAHFVRLPKPNIAAMTWRACADINGERIEAEGRTQITAAITLARVIGEVYHGIDLDAAQAEHDRASRIDPCPSMDEQDRECEAEHAARMLDRD